MSARRASRVCIWSGVAVVEEHFRVFARLERIGEDARDEARVEGDEVGVECQEEQVLTATHREQLVDGGVGRVEVVAAEEKVSEDVERDVGEVGDACCVDGNVDRCGLHERVSGRQIEEDDFVGMFRRECCDFEQSCAENNTR